jgi:hypothetical protein
MSSEFANFLASTAGGGGSGGGLRYPIQVLYFHQLIYHRRVVVMFFQLILEVSYLHHQHQAHQRTLMQVQVQVPVQIRMIHTETMHSAIIT